MDKSIYDVTFKFFDNSHKIKHISEIMLVLILKINNLEFLKQFWSINLCNIISKIVTKIIVNKLKPYLGHLIFPNQYSFIPSGHGSNNIIIT